MPRVLIVDDDENNRAVISDALCEPEFQLDEAADGRTALGQVASSRPDVILLDVVMPGLDGLETLRQLKAKNETRDIPVIMVTALNMDSQIAACLDAGAVDHVAKPFSNTVLRARLRAALRSRSAPTRTLSKPARRGRVLTFLGAKGGVGTTTLAINAAAKLQQTGKDVIVCELRTDCGTAAAQLAATPKHNLGQFRENGGSEIAPDLLAWLVKDRCGLRVLFGPQEVTARPRLTPDLAREILDTLAGASDFTVVDLPHYASDASDAALTRADFVVLVVELEPVSVAAAQKALARLRSLGTSNSIGVVANSRALLSSAPVKLADLRTLLGCNIIGAIPPAPDACAVAAKNGSLLVALQPDSTAASAIQALAARLAAEQVAALTL